MERQFKTDGKNDDYRFVMYGREGMFGAMLGPLLCKPPEKLNEIVEPFKGEGSMACVAVAGVAVARVAAATGVDDSAKC